MINKKIFIYFGLIFFTLVGLFQNCAEHGFISQSSQSDLSNTPKHGLVSPFNDNQVILSSNFRNRMLKASSKLSASTADSDLLTIPKGSELTFIGIDSCIRTRLNNKTSNFKFFIDKYISSDFLSQSNDAFDRLAINVTTKNVMTLADLDRILSTDSCLIGVSDSVGNSIATNSNTTTSTPIDTTSLQNLNNSFYKSIRFEDSQSFFSSIPSSIKVKVATIDTGLDLKNSYIKNITTQLQGSDTYGQTDIPQDIYGHGTQVLGLIGSVLNAPLNNIIGLATNITTLIPLRALDNQGLHPSHAGRLDYWIFTNIKRSFNMGAEVVNLSYTYGDKVCNPVVGYAIFYAIQRGVFFSIAAGEKVGSNDSTAVNGEVISPKDSAPMQYSNTSFPACWGRYFKGAITVGGIDTGTQKIAANSNWGSDSVEIAAPSTNIPTYGLNNSQIRGNGTGFAAPQVAAAAAHIIGFHKHMGWPYNPWLVEDILLNSMPTDELLRNAPDGRSVHKGKYLDFKSLADYLNVLTTKTPEQRRMEPTDNPEDGVVFSANGSPDKGTLTKLSMFTKNPIIKDDSQGQLQVIAYYSNNYFEVVTGKSTFSTSDISKVTIQQNGVFYPKVGTTGVVSINASFGGLTAKVAVLITSLDLITGVSTSNSTDSGLSPIASGEVNSIDFQIKEISKRTCGTGFNIDVIANYSNGAKRVITDESSISIIGDNLRVSSAGLVSTYGAPGGTKGKISAFYRGKLGEIEFTVASNQKANSFSMALENNNNLNQFTQGSIISYKATEVTDIGNQYCNTDSFLNFIPGMLFPNIKLSSPQARLDEILKTLPPFSGSFNSSLLPVGIYKINYTTTYPGTSPLQTFSGNFDFEVLENSPVALTLALNPTEYPEIQFGNGFESPVLFILKDGTSAPAFNQENLEVTIKSKLGHISQNNFASLHTRGNNGELTSINLHFFDGAPGDEFVITLKDLNSNLTSSPLTYKTHGVSHYNGVYSTYNLPDLNSQIQYPNPTAEDLSFCTPEKIAKSPMADGDGTAANPYKICSIQQFLRIDVTKDKNGSLASFKLMTDLDFKNVGNMSLKQFEVYIFDGSNFEIKNYTSIDSESLQPMGIFKRSWTIKNLKIRDSVIVGNRKVGGLVGLSSGDIINCYNINPIVTGNSIVGGLIGYSTGGEINNSHVINGQINSILGTLGGVLGELNARDTGRIGLDKKIKIINSGAKVELKNIGTAGNGSVIGGLIGKIDFDSYGVKNYCESDLDLGFNCPLILSSYSKGTIIGATSYVGGLIGLSFGGGAIIKSISEIDISASGAFIGGLVGKYTPEDNTKSIFYPYPSKFYGGYNYRGLIYGSKSQGTIFSGKNQIGDSFAGGLIGSTSYSIIENSESTVNVNGFSSIGGLVGLSEEFNQIYNSTSAGAVTGSGTFIGGFIGQKTPVASVNIREKTSQSLDSIIKTDFFINDVYNGNKWKKSVNSSLSGIGKYHNTLNATKAGISEF